MRRVGTTLYQQGRYDEAVRVLAPTGGDPGLARNQEALGSALMAVSRYDEARTHLLLAAADPAVAPLFGIILSLYFLVLTPLLNSIVRTSESEADAFGLNAAREPDGFAMTAMQLSEYRKIEPGKLEEMLFFDHPSGRTRVRMAMDWKAKHLNELPPAERRMFVMQPPPETP